MKNADDTVETKTKENKISILENFRLEDDDPCDRTEI